MPEDDLPFVKVPDEFKAIVGDPDPGTRMYRAYGSDVDFDTWFHAVYTICKGGTVSPGGVAMFAKVSRAGVHKRMKEGRLSAFLYHPVDKTVGFFKREKMRTRPYVDVPVSEIRAWAELIKQLPSRQQEDEAAGDSDDRVGFVDKDERELRRRQKKK